MPDLNSKNLGLNTSRGSASLVLPQATTTQLTTATDPINVKNKAKGKMVLNSTTNKVVVANGATPTSHWYDTAGVDTHTPA
jgi:hypothetical protein